MGVKYLVLYHDERGVFFASTDGASSFVNMERDERRIWSDFPCVVYTDDYVAIRANMELDAAECAVSGRYPMPVARSKRQADLAAFCVDFFDRVRGGFAVAPECRDANDGQLLLVANPHPVEPLTRWGPPMTLIPTSAGRLRDVASRMDALVRECIDSRPSL
jgi:hypothetical protein